MCADLAYPALMGPALMRGLTERKLLDNANQAPQMIKLGDFMLPGLTESRVVYAFGVDEESIRLHLVDNAQQRVA
jgi:hypothetical protein